MVNLIKFLKFLKLVSIVVFLDFKTCKFMVQNNTGEERKNMYRKKEKEHGSFQFCLKCQLIKEWRIISKSIYLTCNKKL